jgi:MFS family permease
VLAAGGAVNVGEIFLARQTFDAGDLGFGLLWTGTGIGFVVGGLVASGWIAAHGVARVYTLALCVFGVGVLAAGISPTIWIAVAAMVVSGIGNGVAVIANVVLVQRGAPDRIRGRAFTVLMSLTYAAMGVGLIVSGPLANSVGARWMYVGAAVVIGCASLTATLLLRGRIAEERRAIAEAA